MKGKTTFNSISIDQAISDFHEGQTQLASMPLSTVGGVGNLSRTYTLSFDKNGKGIPAWSNLKEIYERMYVASSPAAKARLKEKTHLLNEIYSDAKDLQTKSRAGGSSDTRRVSRINHRVREKG